MIQALRDLGTTVFLTTHYMDEAQALADRLAIIADGRIVAVGSPGELIGSRERATRISFALPAGVGAGELPDGLGDPRPATPGGVDLESDEPVAALNRLTGWALANGHELVDLTVSAPSLEEVYLELTEERASPPPEPRG